MTKRLAETVIVKVSVLGMSHEAIGTETFDVDVQLLGGKVGHQIDEAFRRAFHKAVMEITPHLGDLWVRAEGEEGPPEEDGEPE